MPSLQRRFSGRNGRRSTVTAGLPASLPPALASKAPWVVSSESVTTSRCARGPLCFPAPHPPPTCTTVAGAGELLCVSLIQTT
jgi:hypothetical protein